MNGLPFRYIFINTNRKNRPSIKKLTQNCNLILGDKSTMILILHILSDHIHVFGLFYLVLI